jgi:hypothetical protein
MSHEFYIGACISGIVGAAPNMVIKNTHSTAVSLTHMYMRGDLTPGVQYTWTPSWWGWTPTSCEVIEGTLYLTAFGVNI